MTRDPDTFVSIEAATSPVFSCDGGTLFHLRGSSLPQVWALDLASGASRQLTFHDEKVGLLRRCPVDDRLIYGFDRGGDERQQLLLLDPADASSASVQITANPAVIHDFGAWSPDGAAIAYCTNERDEAHFDVYIHDMVSGSRRRVHDGRNMLSVSAFSPDGTKLALLNDRGFGDVALVLLDLGTGKAQAAEQTSNLQKVRWASDGKTLLALTDCSGEFLELCQFDPESNVWSALYAADGCDVEAWSISSDQLLLATVENDRGYSVLRVGPLAEERPVVADLPAGVVSDLTWSPDGTTLAFSVTAAKEPSSLWLWRDGAARPAWRPAASPDLADFELVSWESFDGTNIPGWLMLPHGPKPHAGHPAIIWVHGGPVGQARPVFRPDIQMLVAQGFAVLLPNVRGSSGYGRKYTQSDDVESRLDSVADLAHGRAWLAEHPDIDGARVGIMGQSYGGFMVMSAITEYPDLWRAAVNYYGIADFTTLLAGTGPWRRNHRAAEYGEPERDATLFARISPIHNIDRARVPVLIAHGERDPRVPISESKQYVKALRERQMKVSYLTFDYAGHGFVRPDDRRRVYRAVADFFRTHLC